MAKDHHSPPLTIPGMLRCMLGMSGISPQWAVLARDHDVGITPTEMKRLLKELHLHSIECLHNVVIQRRMLDSQALRHQTPRPP